MDNHKENVLLDDETKSKRMQKPINKRAILCGLSCVAIGFGLFILGFVIKYSTVPAVIETQVYKNLDIVVGSETYNAFVDTPVPIFLSFNFFHILNPEAVKDGSEAPRVQEIGPYSFLEYWKKLNVFEIGQEHLVYDQYKEYYYDQDQTDLFNCKNVDGEPCGPNDPMTIINPILPSIATIVPSVVDRGLVAGVFAENITIKLQSELDQFWIDFNDAINGDAADCPECVDEVVVETTPIKMLFDGHTYGSMLALQYALDQTSKIPCTELPITDPDSNCSIVRALLLALKAADKFDIDNLSEPIGIFAGGNCSSAGANYMVNNGRFRHDQLINIETWNNDDMLPEHWWPKVAATPGATNAGTEGVCREIEGSDGTQFPAYVKREDRLWVFISDMCRSLWLEYYADSKVFSIDTYDFRPPKSVYNMSYELNFCYCPTFLDCAEPATDGSDTWNRTNCDHACKDGMIRLDNCYAGAPVIMTAPHFLWGDERLVLAFDEGIKPDPELHETMLHVDPLTGLALSAHKRIMISMYYDFIEPYWTGVKIDKLEAMNSSVVFPVLWLDESGEMSESDEKEYIKAVIKPQNIADGVVIGIFMVGGALLFLAGTVLCWFS